jgi:hypothetical protein
MTLRQKHISKTSVEIQMKYILIRKYDRIIELSSAPYNFDRTIIFKVLFDKISTRHNLKNNHLFKGGEI